MQYVLNRFKPRRLQGNNERIFRVRSVIFLLSGIAFFAVPVEPELSEHTCTTFDWLCGTRRPIEIVCDRQA